MASVYGPVEGRLQLLDITRAYVDVHWRPRAGQPTCADRLREQIVRQTAEQALLCVLHPRTAITVQLQEMADDGGLLAAAINAAQLALLNSGCAMRCMVAAVHCSIDAATGDLRLDPAADGRQRNGGDGDDGAEEAERGRGSGAGLTFVFESGDSGRTVAVHTEGRCSVAQYADAQRMCADAAGAVFAFYRRAVAKFAKVL